MKTLTRISRALLMGLAWAAAWLPVSMAGGALMVGELEPEHIGGALYLGFPSGVVFSVLAGLASGRRRLTELSYVRAAGWGAVSGLLIGALPFILGEQHGSDRPLWVLPVMVMSVLSVTGAVSGATSVWVARNAPKESLDAGTRVNG